MQILSINRKPLERVTLRYLKEKDDLNYDICVTNLKSSSKIKQLKKNLV